VKSPATRIVRMSGRTKTVTVVVLLLAGSLAAWVLQQAEPGFEGKSASAWLQRKADNQGDWREVTNAFHHMGPTVAPYIAGRLRKDDAVLFRGYQHAWPRLPAQLRRVLPEPRKPLPEVAAVNAFQDIGPSVIPWLTASLRDRSPAVRSSAAWSLEVFRRSNHGSAVVVAELTRALEDVDARVRRSAASALGEFGPEADSAVVKLIARLGDSERGPDPGMVVAVRAGAARALGRIGPRADAAIPALSALCNEAFSYTRMEADIARWRIQGSVRAVLPALVEDLGKADELTKWEVLGAMTEMGPAARDAVPAIIPYLRNRMAGVRQLAAEALWKIDPGEAPAIVEAITEPMNASYATTDHQYSVTRGARLLGEMGPAARSAAPSLIKLSESPYPAVRAAALEALKRMDASPEEGAARAKGTLGEP